MKTIEDTQHPDRDAQFRYLNEEVRHFVRRHDPVVSVDTKTSTISSPGVGKAIPYGTYDVTRDEAVFNVGITHETAEFAVQSIRRW